MLRSCRWQVCQDLQTLVTVGAEDRGRHCLRTCRLTSTDAPVQKTLLPVDMVPCGSELWRSELHGSMLAIPYAASADVTQEPEGVVMFDCASYSIHVLELQAPPLQSKPAAEVSQRWHIFGWSASRQLLVIQHSLVSREGSHLMDMFSGCVQQVDVTGAVSTSIPVDASVCTPLALASQDGYSPDGRTLVFADITPPEGENHFWVCELDTGSVSLQHAGSPDHQWTQLAWEPSSERLLLCSQLRSDVLLWTRGGNCMLQGLTHSAEAGAVWTAKGVAIAERGSLFLYAAAATQLTLLHTVQLHPSSIARVLHLAASWDGRYVAAHMTTFVRASVGMLTCMLVFVAWENGSLQQHTVPYEMRRWSRPATQFGWGSTALLVSQHVRLTTGDDGLIRHTLLVRPA